MVHSEWRRCASGTIIPAAVDVMWGTDLTTTLTGQGQAAVFVAVDHHSAECVGIHAAPRATRFLTMAKNPHLLRPKSLRQ
jgi:hypothetical protein